MSGASKNLNKAILAAVAGPGVALTTFGAEQAAGLLKPPSTPAIPTPAPPPVVPPVPESPPPPPSETEIGAGIAKQQRRRPRRFGIADTLLVRPGLGSTPAALGA